jgi:HTH-type transcriptional regulator / antitoxin HipB
MKMKEIEDINILQTQDVIIDKRLNYLSDKVLFPEKLKEAKETLARVGVPNLAKIRENDKTTPNTNTSPLGSMIKEIRLQRKLSQKDLAALVGEDKAMIIRLENNDMTLSMALFFHVFKVLDAELSFTVKGQ